MFAHDTGHLALLEVLERVCVPNTPATVYLRTFECVVFKGILQYTIEPSKTLILVTARALEILSVPGLNALCAANIVAVTDSTFLGLPRHI